MAAMGTWVRRRKWLVAGVLVVLVAAALLLAREREHLVQVTQARQGPLELRIAASGLVEQESADLAFECSGEIVKLYAREGEHFAKSSVLARVAPVGSPLSQLGGVDAIQAPYDGTVVAVYVREGTVVGPGQAVMRVVSAGQPWVTAFVDSADAAYLRPGDRLRCRSGGYLSEAWNVVVRSVGQEAVTRADIPGSSRQVRVRCDVADPIFPLAPGTELDVDGQVQPVKHGVLIPTAAVVHGGLEDHVWVVEEERAHRRAVELGPNNFDLIQVRAGLRPGERVVVQGKEGLQDGQRVRDEPMPAPTETQKEGL